MRELGISANSFKRKTEHQKGTTNRGGGYRNKNHTLPKEFSLKKKRGRKWTSKGTENWREGK